MAAAFGPRDAAAQFRLKHWNNSQHTEDQRFAALANDFNAVVFDAK
jgi:hypothetical protein